MIVRSKIDPDPLAELYMPDVYMRWALLAAEQVTGKGGLAIVLRQVGLEHLIDNYPSDDLTVGSRLTCGDYASLFAGLVDFYGRAGKSMLLCIGRLTAWHSLQRQSPLLGAALGRFPSVLPLSTQPRVDWQNIPGRLGKIWSSFGRQMKLRIEDRGDRLAYVAETCPMCAGVQADGPICLSFTGTLQESMRLATGKEFAVEEVECRAAGALACVWEISKHSLS